MSLDFSREQLTGDYLMHESTKIREVLNRIPTDQYVEANRYRDITGKEGFRNPVRAVVGKGLTRIVEQMGFKDAVELGTGPGSSGLHLALGGLRTLNTVEQDSEAAQIARTNFAEAELPGFTVHNMDSGRFIGEWVGSIQLVLFDHAKPRYLGDLQALEPFLDPNALVLMDNTYNRASECKDAVAYVADNYYSAIFTEPPTDGETTGLLVASKDRYTFNMAMKCLLDVRDGFREI